MKKALVIGAARSGLAVSRLLNQKGYEVTLTDMKPVSEKDSLIEEGIAVLDEGHPESLKKEDWDLVVKNPGIPYHAPFVAWFVEHNVPIFTEIDIASRFASNLRYAAITGTDGKTTTTTLLHEMLKRKDEKAKAAGNIGLALSELVLQDEHDLDVAMELSNFQLLGMENFHAHVASITNLAPDHLDYMKDLESYYRSKFRILQNMSEEDVFILNIDDDLIPGYLSQVETPARIVSISLDKPADIFVKDGQVFYHDTKLFDVKDVHMVGSFNLMNAMMAAGLAYFMGVSPQDIQKTIQDFSGVEHRIEYAGELDGVRIYNDSKSTSSHSTQAALSAFEQPVILLCGGFNKGIDYTDLKKDQDKVKACLAFGKIGPVFKEVFNNTTVVETMEEALDEALALARPGDTILLSPATSSFDQFKNYEERGRVFKEQVRRRIEHGHH